MQTRTMTGQDVEESRRDRTGADGRWILAVGKRVDHRWIMEASSLGRRNRMLPTRGGGRPAHAA